MHLNPVLSATCTANVGYVLEIAPTYVAAQ
jgi:hypothetical protein